MGESSISGTNTCTHTAKSAKFLISQQKYLELLEARKTAAALHILREELAPLSVEPDQLHSLSRSVLPILVFIIPLIRDAAF